MGKFDAVSGFNQDVFFFLMQIDQKIRYRICSRAIQISGWLIAKQDFRLEYERTRDGGPLTLST